MTTKLGQVVFEEMGGQTDGQTDVYGAYNVDTVCDVCGWQTASMCIVISDVFKIP